MANYNNLKAGIDAVIKTNGRQEISGAALNAQLKNMIAELGAGYQYMGMATPATNPGTPDANVFYLASEAGTYTNFGGIVINENEVCALVWNGTWTKEVTGIATADQLSQLGQETDDLDYMISDIDGHPVNREYKSYSDYYHKRINYSTTGVLVGDTVAPHEESEGNNCFVIPCRKGLTIKSRTRYDSNYLWMVVDEDFKVLQIAAQAGLVTTEQTIQVTEDAAKYFIANQRGYQSYNDEWVRVLYSYEGENRIDEVEEAVKFSEQALLPLQKRQANANLGINDIQFTDSGNANAVIKEFYSQYINPENITQITILYATITSSSKYRAKVSVLTIGGLYNLVNQDYDTQNEALASLCGVLKDFSGGLYMVLDTEALTPGNEYNYTNLTVYGRCKKLEMNPTILDYLSRTFVFKNLIVGNVASWGSGSPFSFRNDLTYTISGTEIIITNVGTAGYNIFKGDLSVKNGHLYYMSANMQSSDPGDGMSIVQNGTIQTKIKHSGDGAYQLLSLAHRFEESVTSDCEFRLYNPANVGAKNTRIKFITILDLSDIYGIGKEPDIAFIDDVVKNVAGNYIDNAIGNTFEQKSLAQEIDSLNAITGETIGAPVVVTPSMSGHDIAVAINGQKNNFATLCKCFSASFNDLDPNVSLLENYETINHNFRKDIAIKGKSIARLCNDINSAFTEPIYRFCDAKLGGVRKMSLSTGMQADEPSAIVSEDGNTLYIYAHLKRISSVDGIHWTSAIDTPLSGDVTYIMHNNVNIIDGVYYMIGATSNSGGDLCLFTSTDGINFIYQGKLFEAGATFGNDLAVANWGNTYLHKDRGNERFYLYIEYQASGRFWEIALAMCSNILSQNEDGTIGDWTYPSDNPILSQNPNAAGNPDLAKLGNETLKVNGKYFMYFHGTTGNGNSNIYRAWSEDLIVWHKEGVIFDNRDQPTGGDNTSGNADHCIIEFKGRTYLFYSWDINNPQALPYIKYTIDNRRLTELLTLRP